mgnify:CR=1
MLKGVQTRLIAHYILCEIVEKYKNFDEIFNSYIYQYKLSVSDTKFIQNIVLTAMRYNLHVIKIISKYVKKNKKTQQNILLLSAITQLVFLDFKDYAVVNSSVEIAKLKKINIYPGFINAVLKKIIKDKEKLKKIKINYDDLPKWFLEETYEISSKEKEAFLNSILNVPNLHIVFKNETLKKSFNLKYKETSKNSVYIDHHVRIKELPNYYNGDWWVQDYSAMLPLYLIKNFKGKKIIDLCAAPGGKSFQIISKGGSLDIYEISKRRAKTLEENLKRLGFNNSVFVEDSLKINNDRKYDYVLVDAPCSSVGTIRRNPEIFFRKNKFEKEKLLLIQKKLLEKASLITKKKGVIVYMVCSFLKIETIDQINSFLKKNNTFTIKKFNDNIDTKEFIDENGYVNIKPKTIKGFNVDGFFAAQLIKND